MKTTASLPDEKALRFSRILDPTTCRSSGEARCQSDSHGLPWWSSRSLAMRSKALLPVKCKSRHGGFDPIGQLARCNCLCRQAALWARKPMGISRSAEVQPVPRAPPSRMSYASGVPMLGARLYIDWVACCIRCKSSID